MKKISILGLFIIILLSLGGCVSHDQKADIYTSIYPLEFLATRIVGDNLVVKSAYPRGANVHDYEIPPRRIVNMSESKAIFYVGAGLEVFIQNAKDTSFKNLGDRLVELSKCVDLLEQGEGGHSHSHNNSHDVTVDPHVWLDPIRMVAMAEKMYETLVEVMPEKEEEFTENVQSLIDDLRNLDKKFREELADDLYGEKYILVDHDAYIYWEDRYDIKRIRTRPDNQTTDIDPKTLAANLALINQYKIKYIVVTENAAASSVVDTYQREANLEKRTLYSLATISDDDYEKGLDYIDLMEYNLRVLKEILPKKIK
ncbi:MAG TPA: metal ABC transporter substrate-binding protein [Bacilli bacterium]